jgi:hypothetical protein
MNFYQFITYETTTRVPGDEHLEGLLTYSPLPPIGLEDQDKWMADSLDVEIVLIDSDSPIALIGKWCRWNKNNWLIEGIDCTIKTNTIKIASLKQNHTALVKLYNYLMSRQMFAGKITLRPPTDSSTDPTLSVPAIAIAEYEVQIHGAHLVVFKPPYAVNQDGISFGAEMDSDLAYDLLIDWFARRLLPDC